LAKVWATMVGMVTDPLGDKSGVSTSVGRRGLWFTFGPRGTRTTVSLPGSGIRYSEQMWAAQTSRPGRGPSLGVAVLVIVVLVVLAFV